MDLRNTKIWINSEEESRIVQEYAFKQNIKWYNGYTIRLPSDLVCLFFYTNTIEWGSEKTYFKNHPHKEIFLSDILQPQIHELW